MAAPRWQWKQMQMLSFFSTNGFVRFVTIRTVAFNVRQTIWQMNISRNKNVVVSNAVSHPVKKNAAVSGPSCLQRGIIYNTKARLFFNDCSQRCFSNESPDRPHYLMDFPQILWPSIFYVFRNWFLAYLIIRPNFDRDFDIPEFLEGSKKALEVVSNYIAEGSFENLQGLVTPDAIEEIKKNISSFSVQARLDLAVKVEDIFFSFPHQIGIMFNDGEGKWRKFAEVTVCYHVLRGLTEIRQRGLPILNETGIFPEYRDRLQICNYSFIREFTAGIEDGWIIHLLNHFRPRDQRRFVEITVVYHALRGLTDLLQQGQIHGMQFGLPQEYKNKVQVCNYRFIREYTKGVESDWILNVVNHFQPVEYSK